MATPNKVIEYLDGIKANAYGAEEKFRWICDLDGMVKRIVMQEDGGVDYQYPKDLDRELLIPSPFEGVYAEYLSAMIDLCNKDYNAYNNAAAVFETKFSEFKKTYIRDHMPRSHGGFRGVM